MQVFPLFLSSQDNPLTSWTQKNARGKKVHHAGTENGQKPAREENAKENAKEEEKTKEKQMDLLNDYLKKIQSGEATVEELATKYDNRIKTSTGAATAPVAAATSSTAAAGKENEMCRNEHKIDGQEDNLGKSRKLDYYSSRHAE